MPDFLKETAEIRAKNWTVASIPVDLQDRRVEITGPVDEYDVNVTDPPEAVLIV